MEIKRYKMKQNYRGKIVEEILKTIVEGCIIELEIKEGKGKLEIKILLRNPWDIFYLYFDSQEARLKTTRDFWVECPFKYKKGKMKQGEIEQTIRKLIALEYQAYANRLIVYLKQ
jgi:hypothetical protein